MRRLMLSLGDLVVGPDHPNSHPYGLINGWVRGEEQRRWGNGSGCCVSRCLWPAIDSMSIGHQQSLLWPHQWMGKRRRAEALGK